MTDNDAGLERANALAQKYLSDRYRRIDRLQRYIEGTQYIGKNDWWDDCPLWEKAPCIVYPAGKLAIDSNKELVLGRERFPVITSRPEQDEADEGLDEESSRKLDALIKQLTKEVKLCTSTRKGFDSAQGASTAVALLGARRGKLFIEILSPKRCVPTFDDDGEPTSLEIKYPYLKRDEEKRWQCYLYRRTIDGTQDILYNEQKAPDDGSEPSWSVKSTVLHGFGFCPVIWHKNDPKPDDDVTQFDGHAIHEIVLDEMDALNYALSIRHRAVIYTGDPQLVEIGVEPGTNPTGVADSPVADATPHGGQETPPDGGNPIVGTYGRKRPRGGPRGARKKGPGYPWQYSDPNVKVFYLTLPPGAIESIFNHCEDLYNKLCDSMDVVIPAPSMGKMLQVITGKGIESLRAKQLDRCDGYRDDFGEGFILAAIDKLLRITWVLGPQKLKLPGLNKSLPLLKKFVEGDGSWSGPRLTLKWGKYYRPDAEDEQKTVTTTTQSVGLTTLRTRVQKVAPIFEIEDVETYLASLEAENAEREAKEAEAAHTLTKTLVPKVKPNGRKTGAGKLAGENLSGTKTLGGGASAASAKEGQKPESTTE